MATLTSTPPTKYALLLFPGFQALDVFGPLDVLNILSITHPLTLSIISRTATPVSTGNAINARLSPAFNQSVVPTHTFETAPKDIEVLIVPGGLGLRDEGELEAVVGFVRGAYPRVKWCLSVCTGSMILGRAGVLDGKRATTNKKSWVWATSQCPTVNWVHKARWVVDGNIWTGSGVSAGIDLILAFVEEQYGAEKATQISNGIEYDRHEDPSYDPFAEIWSPKE